MSKVLAIGLLIKLLSVKYFQRRFFETQHFFAVMFDFGYPAAERPDESQPLTILRLIDNTGAAGSFDDREALHFIALRPMLVMTVGATECHFGASVIQFFEEHLLGFR